MVCFLVHATATTEIYTLPLHDALPISLKNVIALAAGTSDGLGFGDNTKAALMTRGIAEIARLGIVMGGHPETFAGDRKSTRLNSSHVRISYAVFCLKKKKTGSPILSTA